MADGGAESLALLESASTRARRDTSERWKSPGFDAVIGVLSAGMGAAVYLRREASTVERFLVGGAAFLCTLAAVALVVYFCHLLAAPIAQRDELRRHLRRLIDPVVDLEFGTRVDKDDDGTMYVDVVVHNHGPTTEFEGTVWAVTGVSAPDYGLFPMHWELHKLSTKRIPRGRRWRLRVARVWPEERVVRFLGPETQYGPATSYKPLRIEREEVTASFEVRDVRSDQAVSTVLRVLFTEEGLLSAAVDHRRPPVSADSYAARH